MSGSRQSWSNFWTVVAALAGVIGAAAAVYPLFNGRHQSVHLAYCCDSVELGVTFGGVVTNSKKLSGTIGILNIHTFSEPVILTGNAISRIARLDSGIFEAGGSLIASEIDEIRDKRVAANQKFQLIMAGGWYEPRNLRVRSTSLERHKSCPEAVGEFEAALEFRSASGLQWARATVPFCLRSDRPVHSKGEDDYWRNVPGLGKLQ